MAPGHAEKIWITVSPKTTKQTHMLTEKNHMEKIHLLTTSRNNNHAQRILIIYITWKIYFSHDTGKKIHAEKFKRLLWEIKKKKKSGGYQLWH